jgi:hypothetical protein
MSIMLHICITPDSVLRLVALGALRRTVRVPRPHLVDDSCFSPRILAAARSPQPPPTALALLLPPPALAAV